MTSQYNLGGRRRALLDYFGSVGDGLEDQKYTLRMYHAGSEVFEGILYLHLATLAIGIFLGESLRQPLGYRLRPTILRPIAVDKEGYSKRGDEADRDLGVIEQAYN